MKIQNNTKICTLYDLFLYLHEENRVLWLDFILSQAMEIENV